MGTASKAVVSSLKHPLQQFIKERSTLEEKLFILVKASHQYLCTRLKTTPDIGRKTAIMRIALTGGFERFSSASELCSYAALTPLIRQRGRTVKGRPRISKMENQKTRNVLFMCSSAA